MDYNEIIEMEVLTSIDKYFHAMALEIDSLPIVKEKLLKSKKEQKNNLKNLISQYIDRQFKTIVLKEQS